MSSIRLVRAQAGEAVKVASDQACEEAWCVCGHGRDVEIEVEVFLKQGGMNAVVVLDGDNNVEKVNGCSAGGADPFEFAEGVYI